MALPPLGRDTLASVSVVPPAPGFPKVPVPRPIRSDPSSGRSPKVAPGSVPSLTGKRDSTDVHAPGQEEFVPRARFSRAGFPRAGFVVAR